MYLPNESTSGTLKFSNLFSNKVLDYFDNSVAYIDNKCNIVISFLVSKIYYNWA